MTKILEINNLKKEYHTIKGSILVLNDISFFLEDKEFLSIVGPSGCGKSTILSIIANLDKEYSGNINTHNKRIAYMLQKDSLLPYLSVYENAILGLRLTHNMSKENIKRANDLLDKYGLKEFKNKYPHNLSGGMRQRVALIRTIAIKPDILILDEPFSALDYKTRLEVSKDIYNIVKEEGISAIIVTHDLAEAVAMTTRVIVLSDRPARIKKVINIKLDNSIDPIENRKDKKFMDYHNLLWKELDNIDK